MCTLCKQLVVSLTEVRPINELWERVSPEGLTGFRSSRHFRAPCCLCPHTSESYHYAECDIVIAEDGPYLGEYIATCASRSCGYIGMCDVSDSLTVTYYAQYITTVPLDRLYAQSGLRLRRYTCRCCPSNGTYSCSKFKVLVTLTMAVSCSRCRVGTALRR